MEAGERNSWPSLKGLCLLWAIVVNAGILRLKKNPKNPNTIDLNFYVYSLNFKLLASKMNLQNHPGSQVKHA